METAQSASPLGDEPHITRPYTVIWFEGGRMLVRAFDNLHAAIDVYERIIDQHEALAARIRTPMRAYIGMIWSGYEDD